MSKKVRFFVLAASLVVAGLAIFAVVIGATAPPSYVEVKSPLLLSEVPSMDNPTAEDGNTCWSAPRTIEDALKLVICVLWNITTDTTFEWYWEQSQLDISNPDGDTAIWSENITMTVVYRDGTTCAGSSFLVKPNVYRVGVEPTGPDAAVWQGEVPEGASPECAYTAPQTSTISVIEIFGEVPVTVTLKIAGEVAWEGTATETGVITVPVSIPYQPWSLVETGARSAHGYTEQTHGWMWSVLAPLMKTYLPIILK